MRRRYLRNRARGNIVYPGLIAAWSAKGKSNDDEDRTTLKDLTGNGHDITLNGFAFSEMSGYGGYTQNFNNFQSRRNSSLYKSENKITFSPIDIISEKYCSVNIGERFYNPKKTILNIYNLPENDKTYLNITIKNVNGHDIGVLYINKNGIYNLDIVEFVDGATDRNLIFTLYNPISTDGITIEQVPEYPDALVFDGVNDYGINENMPILTDYTIIAKRKDYTGACLLMKGGLFNESAFIFEGEIFINNTYNFGAGQNVNLLKDLDISWQTKLFYNEQLLFSGSGIDTKGASLGKIEKTDNRFFKGAFYSAYLFDRSLDKQEIKAFIRKYIDPEYLLPSEIPTPDCYYDFSKGSNDDETRDTIKDLSGNGNDAVAHNFAWSGMSGYNGYSIDFKTEYAPILKLNKVSGTLTSSKITITSVIALNNFLESNRVEKHKSYKIKVTGVNDDLYIRYFYSTQEYYNIKTEGIHVLPESDEVQFIGFRATKVSDSCNITIELIPEYPGALVFDGVDDYVSLDAFDSGFKIMFMECNYMSLNTILYDQRKVGTEQEDCINTSAYEAGFYGRNKYGKTYINGVYNKPDSTLIASKLSNKHILITSAFKGDYTSTPCIASHNINKGMYGNMALYKLLGFKEALTEEQIQYVIKKYNLLDGVDEIEVS